MKDSSSPDMTNNFCRLPIHVYDENAHQHRSENENSKKCSIFCSVEAYTERQVVMSCASIRTGVSQSSGRRLIASSEVPAALQMEGGLIAIQQFKKRLTSAICSLAKQLTRIDSDKNSFKDLNRFGDALNF